MTERNPLIQTLDNLFLDSSPYLSCDDCFEQIDGHVERLATDPNHQDLAMQVHLMACGACADEAEVLMELLSGRVGDG